MESVSSVAVSVGSTTAIGVEDDANNFSVGTSQLIGNHGETYHTPKRTTSLPFCGSTYEPECDGNLQPVIGMQFDTWEDGMAFYKSYAHEVGFSVRTWTTHKDGNGVPVWKRFFCARQGWRQVARGAEDMERIKPKRKFKLSRCGCEAMIGFKKKDDVKYEVARFVQSHTHQLISPSKRHLIKSNREVSSELRSKLFTCHKALVGTSAAYRLVSVEHGGQGKVGCTKRDFQNCHRDFKRAIKGADGQIIVDIMKSKQTANPAFYFDYQVDENNKLTKLFWADSICRKNYSLFGEVVSFDSTYRFNRYDLVFAPFTGVNNHKSSVTFGAAFLWNKKKESYEWLFQTFLKAMSGVAPKLIMTDEDQSMRKGIEKVFPDTVHRLCMWHILSKLTEKVGATMNKNLDFHERFMSCVWSSETPGEFESEWYSIIADFGLQDNTWLQDKYESRHSWIPAYFLDIPLGGILRTTSRSESENAFFRHFANRNLALIEFWVRFETAIEEQRHKELQEDNASLHTLPLLETCWAIESHAREVYTHEIFAEFQQQVMAARDHCHVKSMEHIGEVQTTTISSNSGKVRVVSFNTSNKETHCSCRMFEPVGIICRHIIVVLKNGGHKEIPSQYVLHRWTKMAARKLAYDADGHELEGSSTCLSPTIQKLYSETCSKFRSALYASKHCEEKMRYLHRAIGDAFVQLGQIGLVGENLVSEQSKVQEFESFIGTSFPSVINIHPPDVAKTKGSGKRLKRGSEQTAKNNKKRSKTVQKVQDK